MIKKVMPVFLFWISLIAPHAIFAEMLWDQYGVPICTQAGAQWYEQLISDGQGGAIIVWEDNRNGNKDIYMQRLDGQGNRLWASDGIALTSTTNDQTVPEIVADGAGGAIVAWLDSNPGDQPKSIYIQRIDGNGNFIWANTGNTVCSISTGYRDYFQMIEDGSGGAFVTWNDSRNGYYDVFVQHIDQQGNATWIANGINICAYPGDQRSPTFIADGLCGLIITWNDSRISGFNHDIYAQRVDASGNTKWTDGGVVICNAPYDQMSQRITGDSQGGAEIFWTDMRAGNEDIYVQRINQNGEIQWLANGIPVINTSNRQRLQEVISDGVGGAILAWTDSSNNDDYDLYSQRIDQNGNKLWASYGIAICNAPYNQLWLTMISDGAGGAIYIWPDSQNGARQIYLQRADSAGIFSYPQNGVVICPTTHTQMNASVLKSDSNTIIIVWEDIISFENIDFNLYAQKWKLSSNLTPTPTIAQKTLPLEHGEVRAFPNPAKDVVHFIWGESQAEKVRVEIFNTVAERVAAFNENVSGRGVDWNSKGIAPGIYFCRITLTVNGAEQKLPVQKVAITR